MYIEEVRTGSQARAASDLNLKLIDGMPRFSKTEVMQYREKQYYVDHDLKAVLMNANCLISDVAYNIDYLVGYEPREHVAIFYGDDDPEFIDVSGDSISGVLKDVMRKVLREGLV
jgi:hypothetical protein